MCFDGFGNCLSANAWRTLRFEILERQDFSIPTKFQSVTDSMSVNVVALCGWCAEQKMKNYKKKNNSSYLVVIKNKRNKKYSKYLGYSVNVRQPRSDNNERFWSSLITQRDMNKRQK